MNAIKGFLTTGVLTLFLTAIPPIGAEEMPETPVLDLYIVGQATEAWDQTRGFFAQIHDPNLGNGTARTTLQLRVGNTNAHLFLRVRRTVPPGQIVFALLVDRVEVRARNLLGEEIYARDLPGFVFGDSAGGRWSVTLRDLPANTAQVVVTFFGNYE